MSCYFTRSSLKNKSKKSAKRQKQLVLPPERFGPACIICDEQSTYCVSKRKDGKRICENCFRKLYIMTQATRKEWIWNHKKECGCTLCDESDPRCLDYHHMHPEKKKFSIGSVSSAVPTEAYRIEIAKCVVLCANCHRKIEAVK